MTPFKSNSRFRFGAFLNGELMATVDVFDVQDKQRSARKVFKRKKIVYDEIKFIPNGD